MYPRLVYLNFDIETILIIFQGFAFAEYLDPEVTDMAIQGLHNFALGDRNLVVQRAAVGRNTGVNAPIPGSAAYLSQASKPSSAYFTLLSANTVTFISPPSHAKQCRRPHISCHAVAQHGYSRRALQ